MGDNRCYYFAIGSNLITPFLASIFRTNCKYSFINCVLRLLLETNPNIEKVGPNFDKIKISEGGTPSDISILSKFGPTFSRSGCVSETFYVFFFGHHTEKALFALHRTWLGSSRGRSGEATKKKDEWRQRKQQEEGREKRQKNLKVAQDFTESWSP